MREVSDQAQQTQLKSSGLAPEMLSGVSSLPPVSMDIAPLDPMQSITSQITKDNFPTFNDSAKTSVANNDKSILPEQLNTDKPQSLNAVQSHLQKVADSFTNYSNKLLNAIKPQDKQADGTNSNLSNHKCPFVAVANAVGLKIGGTQSADASASGKGGNTLESQQSLQAQTAESGGAPAHAVAAAAAGEAPKGACPMA
jgi:hypothetical protein